MYVYALITPIVLSLLLLEIVVCIVYKKKYYNFEDAVANINTMLGAQCVNVGVAILVFIAYGWIHETFSVFSIPSTWWSWIILLVLIDFIFYWFHRWGHRINILWAAHSPHHSSEEMNFSVGLRASLTQRLFSFSFFWPLCILGFSPEMIYMGTGIHLLIGYSHHTRLIGKLGWFEKYFNTPSHHRVHHGVNPQYIDKNYAELFIFWDRIFGTFEEENEPVRYGVTEPIHSYDAFDINFYHFKHLWRMTKATSNGWEKVKLWFMPPDWLPESLNKDLMQKQTFKGSRLTPKKFHLSQLSAGKAYFTIHVVLNLIFLFFIMSGSSPLNGNEKWIGSLIVFIGMLSWGRLLNHKKLGRFLETIRLISMAVFGVFMIQKYEEAMYTSLYTSVISIVSGFSLLFCWRIFSPKSSKQQLVKAL